MKECLTFLFKNLFDYHGRVKRKGFIILSFILFVTPFIILIPFYLIGDPIVIHNVSIITGLLLFFPNLFLMIKRLHDINLSGWFVLIGIIPIIGLLFLVYLSIKKGTEGENKYGAPPVC